ncbi:MAG TPA: hypothetical protein VF715_07120 [Thermoleophilaceae bacterium]|jgi:hypothetical protein
MRCSQCAAESFSAAAKTLVERGDRCPQCGGVLALAPVERRQPVGVAAQGGGDPEPDDSGRRFERGRRGFVPPTA